MTHQRRDGFTLIELLIVVVIIGILAAIAANLFWGAKEQAFLSAMKSDLRTLTMQQENYHASNLQYAATEGDMPEFSESSGVSVTITFADAAGWAATASHAAFTGHTCGVFVGGAPAANGAPATQAGHITCD